MKECKNGLAIRKNNAMKMIYFQKGNGMLELQKRRERLSIKNRKMSNMGIILGNGKRYNEVKLQIESI